MAKLDSITATYRVVTPMFLGDARRQATRFSLASFKGVLRWWWRALMWPEVLEAARQDSQAGCDPRAEGAGNGLTARALRELSQREAWIFGVAGSDDHSRGQARVLLRQVEWRCQPASGSLEHPGIRYLTYGVERRKYFGPGETFTIELCWIKDSLPTIVWQRIVDALKLLGLVGSLGARGRRALGSIALERLSYNEVPCWAPPVKVSKYASEVEAITAFSRCAATNGDGLPPFTALYPHSKFRVFKATSHLTSIIGILPPPIRNWSDALSCLGVGFLLYRSNGMGGYVRVHADNVTTRDSVSDFPGDHGWFDSIRSNPTAWASQLSHENTLPERIAFGLPHNYFSRERPSRRQLKVQIPGNQARSSVGTMEISRRGSPLLLHVHQVAGEYVFAAAFMPASFLPEKLSDLPVEVEFQHQQPDPRTGQTKFVRDRTHSGQIRIAAPLMDLEWLRLTQGFVDLKIDGNSLFDVVRSSDAAAP